MKDFNEIFIDSTKYARKIKKGDYLDVGEYPIIDQGQQYVIGYTNDDKGLFIDTPAIIFGDHTRAIKYIDEPFFVGADGVKVLKSSINEVNYKYLYYALSNVHIENTGYNRHFKWLKESKIKLPDLIVQEQIVEVLDKIQETIILKQQQLMEYNQLIKSRFVEMFGDPKINDKNLLVVNPADISERIFAGGDKPKDVSKIQTEEFPYPIFSNGEKENGLYGWAKEYRVEEKSITVSGRGTIGFSCLREGKFTPIIRLITIIPNERVNSTYLNHLLNIEREDGSGTGVKQLTVPMFKKKSIILPDKVKQDEFADFVEQVDKLKFINDII